MAFLIIVILIIFIIAIRYIAKSDSSKVSKYYGSASSTKEKLIKEIIAESDKMIKEENLKKLLAPLEESINKIPKYLFFDCETTGLPIGKPESYEIYKQPNIVQLAYILTDADFKLILVEDYIINQNIDIPLSASNIHGITNEIMKSKGIEANLVFKRFIEVAEKAEIVVAHNIEFDYAALECELLKNGFKTILHKKQLICTMISTINFCKLPRYNGGYKYPKLIELVNACYGVNNIKDLHNANTDVILVLKCFEYLVNNKIISDSTIIKRLPKYRLPRNFKGFKTDNEIIEQYKDKSKSFGIAQDFVLNNNLHEAIETYKQIIDKYCSIEAVKKLVVIYRKLKQYENEMELLQYFINNVEESSSSKDDIAYCTERIGKLVILIDKKPIKKKMIK